MSILDLKVWIELHEAQTVIMNEFYSKDVASKITNAKSAIPWNTKRTVLTQEFLRVVLNCSTKLLWNVPKQHAINMLMKMQYSGFDKKIRYEVVKSALKV